MSNTLTNCKTTKSIFQRKKETKLHIRQHSPDSEFKYLAARSRCLQIHTKSSSRAQFASQYCITNSWKASGPWVTRLFATIGFTDQLTVCTLYGLSLLHSDIKINRGTFNVDLNVNSFTIFLIKMMRETYFLAKWIVIQWEMAVIQKYNLNIPRLTNRITLCIITLDIFQI